MDQLTFFGLFAVTLMLIFYALEDRSPWFILAFATACGLGSAYGFLQRAWPFEYAAILGNDDLAFCQRSPAFISQRHACEQQDLLSLVRGLDDNSRLRQFIALSRTPT